MSTITIDSIPVAHKSFILFSELGYQHLLTQIEDLFYGSGEPKLFETRDGETISLFHHGPDELEPTITKISDIVVCCHPEHLHIQSLKKHIFNGWRGRLRFIPELCENIGNYMLSVDFFLYEEDYEPIPFQ